MRQLNFWIKGAEANLYTFREKPEFEGMQICFRTLYADCNSIEPNQFRTLFFWIVQSQIDEVKIKNLILETKEVYEGGWDQHLQIKVNKIIGIINMANSIKYI